MTITHGVDEVYYRSFVLSEDGLKEFHKLMENAAQRFPAPAEIVYTVVTSDFRYFETRRLEDVLHDPDVQDKSIIQLTMEAGFVEGLPRIEGDVIQKGTRENWNVHLMFTLRQRGLWESQPDKISLRVTSEERKWAYDYIDRFEQQIYRLPSGGRTPLMLFWLFAIPFFILVNALITQGGQDVPWLTESLPRYSFYTVTLVSMFMVSIGVSLSLFKFNPQILRLLFGPVSGFVWGEGQGENEAFEKFRHFALWVFGILFILVMLASVKFRIG
jgi:hypothetical protein